jgi:hypothetical protein
MNNRTFDDRSPAIARRIVAAACCATVSFFAVIAPSAPASADVLTFLEEGKPLADIRTRYESVDDKTKIFDANAYTFRARLGYQTPVWNGLSGLAEFDQLWTLGGTFNSTRNGKVLYPTVADPAMTALNRLALNYTPGYDTAVSVGRQRILLADQRFVGNAGWRQHEQTFDALTLTNASVKALTLTYAYVDRVNRVYGPASPVPASGATGAYHCDCHLLDASYTGVPQLKLEAFGLLLALDQRQGPQAAKLAAAKLSAETFGVRAEYLLHLTDDLSAGLLGTYAHQSNYRNNPVKEELGYWRAEGNATYAGLTGTVGYEAMQGNGLVGFSTPLATTHAFDGWADLFLTTPANGLDNLYLKASYAVPAVARCLDIQAVTATLIHRDFAADRTRIGIGTEWDSALEFAIDKRASVLLQYANYQGSGVGFGGFPDKAIAWLQIGYRY